MALLRATRTLRGYAAAAFESKVGPFALHQLESGPQTSISVGKEEAVKILTQMIKVRRMETSANEEYRKKNIRGFLHLYSGQEACAVGIKSELSELDSVMTAYRCHGWAYLMGASPLGVIAELMGRQTGCSLGKGGSMHMYTPKFYGGAGIVGAQVPIGAGHAFAHKYKGENAVSVTLYGDGAANQGQVFEAFNMAKLWSLPVVFVCENNKYAMGTSQSRHSASTTFFTRGDYIPGIHVNGMNVLDVKSAFKYAREHAITKGPILLELETYRYYGHSMSDPDTTYRTKDEIQHMRESTDPINSFAHTLVSAGVITDEEVKGIEKAARDEMREVVEKALASPFPPQNELYSHVLLDKAKDIRGCDYWTRYSEN